MASEMQFELEVDEKSFPLPKGEAQSRDVLPEDVRKILRGLDKPFDSFSAEVSRKVHALIPEIVRVGRNDDHMCECHARCKMLARALYEDGYTTRIARAGNPGCPEIHSKSWTIFKNMHHVSVQAHYEDRLWIIEWKFKDYFQTSKPTERYKAVLDSINEVFVGTIQQLKDILKFLCTELQMSFCEQGQELPPWRRLRSMMSRWLPASPHFEIIGPPTLDFERDPSIYDGRIPFQSDTKHVQHGGNLAYAYASAECLAPRQNIGAQQPVRSSLSKALQGGHSPKKSHPKWLASPIFVVGKAGVVRAAG